MSFDTTLYLTVLITLFVIMDPPGAIPVFLSLVGRKSKEERNRAAWQAPAVSLTVITVFAIGGQAILGYLHIGIPALQGAGGLLLLLIALSLLTGKSAGSGTEAEEVNVALVPLGTPLMAGPGAIAAVIVYVSQADGRVGSLAAVALAIVTIHILFFAVLRFSTVLIRILGVGGITLLARIAGLLLAAIAVQLIADSVRGFITGG
ncbi:MarC family protein [Rhodococcus sp. H36-A4]|uniref:MarC family protein n=1 Tax=unclassified Rhodococcus (in: high G+C Gram-positive bacteria) TaxID=192944 RepID=UPI0022B06F9D|nr:MULTISPECIES: MarC family protein [unclassified Rhodococcus (in: high G+C Gram-positive bacteria)]MCZ4079515.1 MarC family protein [Rhodococcus sp. H36-A4]MDJ0358690.1 MarC family protein [Rhodococcus sp. H29-C3]